MFVNYFPELATVYGGFFLASADLAIFSVSFRLALLVMFGLFAVDAFTAPKLAQHFRRDERAQLLTVVRQATALKLLATGLVSLFFVVAGTHVLRLFGEEFTAGYVPLLILLAGQVAQAAIGSAVRLLSISGHHRDALHTSLVTMALWLVIATALGPAYGVVGLATSVALSLAAWSALLRHFVMKRMQIDPLIRPRDLGGTT